MPALAADEWVAALPPSARAALAAKLWRISIFGAVHHRAGAWLPGDRRRARRGRAAPSSALAPSAVDVLSRADRALIAAIADPGVGDEVVDARSAARRRFATPAALLPAKLGRIAAREAPLRFSAATWLAARG